jgi:hypothetical protein
MRFIQSLLMLVIGMISFTVLGTTTHQEQKQKPVFKMEQSLQLNTVNVELLSVVSEATIFKGFNYNESFLKQAKRPTLNEAIGDVGWKSHKENYNKHLIKSNSKQLNRIPIVDLTNKGNITIRNDC